MTNLHRKILLVQGEGEFKESDSKRQADALGLCRGIGASG